MDCFDFSAVVFAGGGARCTWQVGFWKEVAPFLKTGPRAVGAVSAGAAMACFIFAGVGEEALEYFQEITGRNPKNAYPGNIFKGIPVFPHLEMYKSALLKFFDSRAIRALHAGPDIRILISRPPIWAGPRLAVCLGFLCYQIEKKLVAPLHPKLAGIIGFRPEIVSVRSCTTPEMLSSLILASSCTPPFTPVLHWNNSVALDGGLMDNVPYRAIEDANGKILFLLTRRYPSKTIPSISGHTYVQPSRPIGISKWDYTNPDGLRDAYELGREDGKRFRQSKLSNMVKMTG